MRNHLEINAHLIIGGLIVHGVPIKVSLFSVFYPTNSEVNNQGLFPGLSIFMLKGEEAENMSKALNLFN